jgi:hypothetical protein
MKRWQLIAIGFVTGSLLTVAAGYAYLQPLVTFWTHAPYVGAASEANLNLSVLDHLSEGNQEAARRIVEGQLGINEAILEGYESAVDKEDFEPQVLEAKAAIQLYRQKELHP